MIVVKVSKFEIMPRMATYLARAGYRGSISDTSPEIVEAARAIYLLGLDLAHPFSAIAERTANEIPKNFLPKALQGCEIYNFILVSLGHEIDERIDRFFAEGEPLKGALLDAWGSEAVETLAHNINEKLRNEHAGMKGTIRFAPGYGDFDIRMNALWLDLIKSSLNPGTQVDANQETGILTPRKSIVCAIGWK